MLRELNEVEMEMVSGGVDEVISTGTHVPDAPISSGTIPGATSGGGPRSYYYNGHEYDSAEAAAIARENDRLLEEQFGDPQPDRPTRPALPEMPNISGIQGVNTGTGIGTVGGTRIGVDYNGGNPRITGRIITQ